MIVVCGSANMDLVARVARLPQPGETVMGLDFQTFPGGKGANQAVAAARLNGKVTFLGKLGEDAHGEALRASLEEAGVDVGRLWRTPAFTGLALIIVDEAGQNQITVIPGANGEFFPGDVRRALNELDAAPTVALAQLEIPLKSVTSFFHEMHLRDVPWRLLNPAPTCELPPSLYKAINVITPNEHEASLLSGISLDDSGAYAPCATWFHEQGVPHVIITLGAGGAFYSGPDCVRTFPAPKVTAVDTTGAGDTFNGALAVGLAEGYELEEVIPFAIGAASISVTRPGAQASMPKRSEL